MQLFLALVWAQVLLEEKRPHAHASSHLTQRARAVGHPHGLPAALKAPDGKNETSAMHGIHNAHKRSRGRAARAHVSKVRPLHRSGHPGAEPVGSAHHHRHYHRNPLRVSHHAQLVLRHPKPEEYKKVFTPGQVPADVLANASSQPAMQSLLHLASEATAHMHMMELQLTTGKDVDVDGTGAQLDPDTFAPVIDMIRQITREQLVKDVGTITSTLARNAAGVDHCAGNHSFPNSDVKASYDTEESEYSTATGIHDAAVVEENTVCTERDTACTNRDAKGQDLYNQVGPSMECGLPAEPDDSVTYDDNFLLADVDVYANLLITKHTAWETAKTLCAEKEIECTEKETATAAAYSDVVTECGQLEAVAVSGAGAYDACYNTAMGVINGYAWDQQIASMQSSVEMLETLICYIEVAMIGLSAPKGEREKRTDASLTCADNAETGMFECTCDDREGTVYVEAYDLSVTPPQVSPVDTSWDDKGCADTGTTPMPPAP